MTGHNSAEDRGCLIQGQREKGRKKNESELEVLCCLLLCAECGQASQPCLSRTHTKTVLTRGKTGREGVAEEKTDCLNRKKRSVIVLLYAEQ